MQKKILLLNFLILILFSFTVPVCAEQCPPIEIPDSIIGTDIDSFTTTRYSPWIVNYNMTKLDQIENGYHGGEAGQKIFAMAISNNGKKVLVGTDTSGIWKSDDSGKSWKSSNIGIDVIGILDLEFANDNNTIYAACSPAAIGADLNSTNKSGLYKSVDGGTSWKQITTLFFERMLSTKRIKYYNGYIYAASTYDGVYKVNVATDQIEYLGLDGYTINSIYVCNGYIIASTSECGNMVSTDNGLNWQAFNQGLNSTNVYATCLNPVDNSTFYCITENELYKSNDGMNSWILLLDSTQLELVPENSFRRLLFGPKDNNQAKLYLGLSNCVYSVRYSDDYGNSFKSPEIQTEHAFMVDNHGYPEEPFVIAPNNPQLMFASFDGEIFKSDDGGISFSPSSSGYSGMRAYNFLFNPDDPNDIWIGMIDRGVLHTVDTGSGEEYPAVNYTPMEDRYKVRYKTGKTVKCVARDPKDPKRIIISIGSWGKETCLKESTDNGLNWNIIPGTEDHAVHFLSFHPQKHNIIYSCELKSIDDGKTWTQLDYPVLAVSPVNGDVVYSHDGTVVYRSDDAGVNWYEYCTLESGLQRITCDSNDVNKIYVGTFSTGLYICYGIDNKVRISESNGLKPNVVGKLPIFTVAQDPKNPLHLVAGGADNNKYAPSAGLFETYDGGNSWNCIDGIPATRDIWTIQFHPTRKQVFIGTSAGVFVYEYKKYVDKNISILGIHTQNEDGVTVNCNKETVNLRYNDDSTLTQINDGMYYTYESDKPGSQLLLFNFDISKLDVFSVKNVTFTFYAAVGRSDGENLEFSVREVIDGWSNETISSNIIPQLSPSSVATFYVGASEGRKRIEIDLTNFIKEKISLGEEKVSIAISSPHGDYPNQRLLVVKYPTATETAPILSALCSDYNTGVNINCDKKTVNLNYNDDSTLSQIKEGMYYVYQSDKPGSRLLLFNFDISKLDIFSVKNITFTFYAAVGSNDGENLPFTIREVINGWSDETVSSNIIPQLSRSPIATFYVGASEGRKKIEIDLTDFIKKKIALGEEKVSFAVSSPYGDYPRQRLLVVKYPTETESAPVLSALCDDYSNGENINIETSEYNYNTDKLFYTFYFAKYTKGQLTGIDVFEKEIGPVFFKTSNISMSIDDIGENDSVVLYVWKENISPVYKFDLVNSK